MSDKCLVNGKHLTPCKPLMKSLMGRNPTGRSMGLFMPSRVNLTTHEPGTDIVQLHSGEYLGRGIALNYCPFCGTEIRTWEAPDSAVKVNNGEGDL